MRIEKKRGVREEEESSEEKREVRGGEEERNEKKKGEDERSERKRGKVRGPRKCIFLKTAGKMLNVRAEEKYS